MLMPARQEVAAAAPSSWLELPHGGWLQAQLSQALAPHCAKVFGYYLARVGHLAHELELNELRVRHQFSATRSGAGDIHTDFEYWPFAEGVLDAVVMVGQLEFERDPHQVLREMSRSLIADGHLILAGLNPLCPARWVGFWPPHLQQLPWRGRYFSRARVCDWLNLLNFEIVASGYTAPSLLLARTPSPSFGLSHLSQVLPAVGSWYYLVAKKREYPLTSVRLKRPSKTPLNAVPAVQRINDGGRY